MYKPHTRSVVFLLYVVVTYCETILQSSSTQLIFGVRQQPSTSFLFVGSKPENNLCNVKREKTLYSCCSRQSPLWPSQFSRLCFNTVVLWSNSNFGCIGWKKQTKITKSLQPMDLFAGANSICVQVTTMLMLMLISRGSYHSITFK